MMARCIPAGDRGGARGLSFWTGRCSEPRRVSLRPADRLFARLRRHTNGKPIFCGFQVLSARGAGRESTGWKTIPPSRRSHMEYLPGMETNSIRISAPTGAWHRWRTIIYYADIRRGTCEPRWSMRHCSIEDFKALLSPAAEPFLEQMAQRAAARDTASTSATRSTCLRRCILPITARITAYTAALTAITISSV